MSIVIDRLQSRNKNQKIKTGKNKGNYAITLRHNIDLFVGNYVFLLLCFSSYDDLSKHFQRVGNLYTNWWYQILLICANVKKNIVTFFCLFTNCWIHVHLSRVVRSIFKFHNVNVSWWFQMMVGVMQYILVTTSIFHNKNYLNNLIK